MSVLKRTSTGGAKGTRTLIILLAGQVHEPNSAITPLWLSIPTCQMRNTPIMVDLGNFNPALIYFQNYHLALLNPNHEKVGNHLGQLLPRLERGTDDYLSEIRVMPPALSKDICFFNTHLRSQLFYH